MLRLSELLERLRPAGTPGAPTEGDQQRQRELREHEIAAVSARLRAFEAEAEQVVAAGRAEADQLRHEGERHAQLVRAQLPDRIAIARANVGQEHDEHGEREIADVERNANREIARIEADAETRIPQVADAVVATIWSTTTSASEGAP